MVNYEVYHTDTRQHADFHQPSMKMTEYQNRVYYLVVTVFNMLPSNMKIQSDNYKKFKLILQKCLYENSFYSVDEYFELQNN